MIRGDIDLTENLDFYHDKKNIESRSKTKSGIVPWYTEKKNLETLQSKLYKYLYSYYYNDSSLNTTVSRYSNDIYTYSGAEWNNLSYTYTNSYYYSLEYIPESYSISINYDNAEDVYEIFDYINDHDLYMNSYITSRVIDDKSSSDNDKLPWGDKEFIKSKKLYNKTDYNHYTYRLGEDKTYKTICHLSEDKYYKINKQIRRNEEEARSAIENDVHKIRERHRLVCPHLNALLEICNNPKNIYDDNKRDTYGEYWYDRYNAAELSLAILRNKNRRKRYNIRSGRIAPWLEKLSSRIYEDYISDLNEEQDYTSYLTNMGWLGMH